MSADVLTLLQEIRDDQRRLYAEMLGLPDRIVAAFRAEQHPAGPSRPEQIACLRAAVAATLGGALVTAAELADKFPDAVRGVVGAERPGQTRALGCALRRPGSGFTWVGQQGGRGLWRVDFEGESHPKSLLPAAGQPDMKKSKHAIS